MRITRKMLLSSFLSLLFLFPAFSSSASAETYQVSEAQLTKLEQTFSQLRQKQSEQETLLEKQKNQIDLLKKQLEKSETAMNSSQESLSALNSSLTAANESFQKYVEEQEAEKNRLRQQQTIWMAVAALAVGYALNN